MRAGVAILEGGHRLGGYSGGRLAGGGSAHAGLAGTPGRPSASLRIPGPLRFPRSSLFEG